MKVSDLIRELSGFPQDAKVILDMECGCFPQDARSVYVPAGIGDPYGKHTGIDNERDVIVSAKELAQPKL